MLQRMNPPLPIGPRRSSLFAVTGCLLCVLWSASVAIVGHAQKSVPPKAITTADNTPQGSQAPAPTHPMTKLEMAQLNQDVERVQTRQLLQLATDLKTQLGKTSENTLSLEVIHKADSIEHLARSLKERIKTTPGKK